MKQFMMDHFKIVEAIKPQTMGSARSGDWVSLKNYNHVTIIVDIAMGHASGSALTVDKATDVSGGGNSDGITILNAYKITMGTTGDTPVKQTSAASFTSSATGSGSECWVFEIDAEELGEYDCIQLEAGSSNASNLLSALYILSDPRFAGAAAGLPSAIID